jgi:transcription elongation factor Elf1
MTIREIDIAAMSAGQIHTCPHCHSEHRSAPFMHMPPKCEECCVVCYPEWDVRDNQGSARGKVYGDTMDDAIESAKQSPQYDSLMCYTVTPSY